MKTVSRLLIILLTVSSSSSSSSRKVVGPAGEDVTLPCKYDFYSNGATSVCWGRGSVPLSGCTNQIISTDGHKVIESSRVSSRYQLLGRLQDGDVSLTILNTTEEDAGQYGCRVEIKGWFNDEKHDIHLTIEKGLTTEERGSDVTTWRGSDVTTWRGSDVTGDKKQMWNTSVPLVNSHQYIFIKNRVKTFFIIFIPVLLLVTAAYRV
ncbi:hypothetical protein PAMP_006533 [Pampus punctatissimus]